MHPVGGSDYDTFVLDDQTSKVTMLDYLGGFDIDLKSAVLDSLAEQSSGRRLEVYTEYIFDHRVANNYPNFDFRFALPAQAAFMNGLRSYTVHPELTFQNFLCSFNGTPHVGRKLLVAILQKLGLFDSRYCSKNFVFTQEVLDGHVKDYVVGSRERLCSKFFTPNNNEFCDTTYSFDYQRFEHSKNIYKLEKRLTESFVHLVSETMATSYYPFYGEKFVYSVVTRGLFVAYAQPGWHQNLAKHYGFKKYENLFDYRFDLIENPIERLIELVSMLNKFSKLSSSDWRDLYHLEIDAIEHNYNHYFSQDYLKCLEKYR